jgi:hypothetical protein
MRDVDGAPAAGPLNWPLVKERCTELGAKTNIEAALLMGMAPRTLDRLRFHPNGGVRLATILHARKVLGLSLDEMFPARSDDRVAA